MLTYQVRERRFTLKENIELKFPNDIELVFVYKPLQPFGMKSNGGRTTVLKKPATLLFNANTGHHFIESKEPLFPLEVIYEDPKQNFKLNGNKLHFFTNCDSLNEVNGIIQSIYYGFPILLNVELADPPYVERVYGRIGNVPFNWELTKWQMEFKVTNQEMQEKKVLTSWQRFNLISDGKNQRLIAALHYFHIACRLNRVGNSPWEFMSEIILNLSKVLEVLFPPKGDGKTRDAARMALRKLEFSDNEIERDFIPAMSLRNEIDVGHVDLSIYSSTQRRILHKYTEIAESAFRKLFHTLLERIQENKFELDIHEDMTVKTRSIEIINKIANNLNDPKKYPP